MTVLLVCSVGVKDYLVIVEQNLIILCNHYLNNNGESQNGQVYIPLSPGPLSQLLIALCVCTAEEWCYLERHLI